MSKRFGAGLVTHPIDLFQSFFHGRFPEEVLQMKNAKAPAEMETVVGVLTATKGSENVKSTGAPHPNAAALFVDFLLSKPGQEIMAAQGRWVSRKDVEYMVDLKGKRMQIPSPDWDDRQVELIKLYNSLFSLR